VTQLIIEHDGSIPNIDAMEACAEFAITNYTSRKSEGYKNKRKVTTKRGYKVEVEEKEHPNNKESPCSNIFIVTTA